MGNPSGTSVPKMETYRMAEEVIPDVAPDLPSREPASDARLTLTEGDDAIAALLGDPDQDPAEGQEGNAADADKTEPEMAEVDDGTLSEDSEKAGDDEADGSQEPTYSGGKYAAGDAKYKLPDGTEITVAELARNNLFQSDYTRKTTELSEKEKAFETRAQEASQLIERTEKEREFIAFFAEAYVPRPPEKPTSDASVDPVAWSIYAQQKEAYDEMAARWNEAKSLTKAQQEEKAKKTEAERNAILARERDKFFEAFPTLKDETKRNAFWQRNVADAEKNYGITKEEVLSLTDHRMVKVLNDANAYRALKTRAPQAKAEIAAKPTMVNGSGKRQNPEAVARRGFQQNVEQLRQSGRPRDADRILEAFID